jgi:hypothetical protein
MQDRSERTIPDEQNMAQFLTTEHFTLQGARNGTISEANGRLGHYLSAVGSGVVALAFVANVSQLQTAFLAFSAVIFPMLIVLGLTTLIRIIQIGINDARLVQAINRIRHYYIELAPEAEPYFSFPHHDDPEAVQISMMPFHSPLQGFASTPGPVILVNSVLVGAFASILSAGYLSLPLLPSIAIGLVALVIAFALHTIYGTRIWNREARNTRDVRFPSP